MPVACRVRLEGDEASLSCPSPNSRRFGFFGRRLRLRLLVGARVDAVGDVVVKTSSGQLGLLDKTTEGQMLDVE